MTKELPDKEAREKIAGLLNVNILVEAGAGSGKTHCLVGRILSLLEQGKAVMGNIVAVTFTRKAAGELKERLQDALEQRLATLEPGSVRSRLEKALLELEESFIGTIHSFCELILRTSPVETGVDPDFQTVDEEQERRLSDQLWQEFIGELQLHQPEALNRVEGMGLSLDNLRNLYRKLSLYPEVTFPCPEASPLDTTSALEALERFLNKITPLMPVSPLERNRWDDLQEAVRLAQRLLQQGELADERQFCRLFTSLERNLRVVQKLWPTRDMAREAQSLFNSFKEETVLPVCRQIREYRYAQIMPLVLPAVKRLVEKRSSLSQLNFQDLLLRTAEALRVQPSLRHRLQQRYTRLLVDEFQDTDPLQAEIIFYLTGQDVEEKDWRRLIPKPGSLFVVGDPKQSIYRFRRADIDTYNLVKCLIRNSGGICLELVTNFRSLPEVTGFVNKAFKKLWPSSATFCQPAFAPLYPERRQAPDTLSGVYRLTVPGVNGHKQSEIARQDARRIASWIRQALDSSLLLTRDDGKTSPITPGDIMILLRYKDDLPIYAAALDNLGIPCHVSGSGTSSSANLTAAYTLLSCLARPDDPVLLAAVLSGPFVGFSDQELWKYRQAGGNFSIFAEVPPGLPADLAEEMKRALERLRSYHRLTRELTGAAAVAAILEKAGFIPWLLAVSPGAISRALQLREYLEKCEMAGDTSFSGLVDRCGEWLSSGSEENLDLNAGTREAVEVMNLHKAKGLEAPVVFLAHPGKVVRKAPEIFIDRSGNVSTGYLQVTESSPYGHGRAIAAHPDWGRLQGREEEYLQAEEQRLLYVAATRARDLLVISSYPEKPEKSPWHLLEEELAEIPEPDHQVVTAWGTGVKMGIDPGEYQEAEELRQRSWEPLRKPGYQAWGVTDLVEEFPLSGRKAGGRGKAWGRAVHRMLEILASGESPELWAGKILKEEGENPAGRDDLLNLIEEVRASDFWLRVELARQRLSEIPLGGMERDTESGLSTCVQGVVDLAFQEDSGWVLADFKSDYYETEEDLQALIAYYKPQLQKYAGLWTMATGEQPVELGLFFTWKRRYVAIARR